jgi:signal peptidase I
VLIALGVGGLVALLLRGLVIEALRVSSGSMIPTLQVGDHIFVSKLSYGLRIPWTDVRLGGGRPRPGDVVLFSAPGGARGDFLKRVVAVAGDTVEISGNQVSVNGRRLGGEAPRPSGPPPARHSFRVPPQAVFVLGDNRDRSEDSRHWGPLSERLIRGRAWLRWGAAQADGTIRLTLERIHPGPK